MDVSCVFGKRDNEYYEFKSEINSKEQIRNFLQQMIGQLFKDLRNGGINIGLHFTI